MNTVNYNSDQPFNPAQFNRLLDSSDFINAPLISGSYKGIYEVVSTSPKGLWMDDFGTTYSPGGPNIHWDYNNSGSDKIRFKAEGSFNNQFVGNYIATLRLKPLDINGNPIGYEFDIDLNVIDSGSNNPPPSTDNSVKYFYREDTNQILVQNLSKQDEYKKLHLIDPIERYGELLVPYNNISGTNQYEVRSGFNIPIRKDNALYLFYGNSKTGAGGIDSLTHGWKYNRHLHKPYRIFILTTTGSNNNSGLSALKVEKVYVDFKNTPSNNQDGTYIFSNVPNGDITIEANALVKSLDRSINSSSTLKTWPTASINLYKGNQSTGLPGTIIESVTTSSLDMNKGVNIKLTTNLSPNDISVDDVLSVSVSVSSGSEGPDFVKSSLIVDSYGLIIRAPGDTVNMGDLADAYFDNWNRFTKNLDCQPDLNNVDKYRPNDLLYNLEYRGTQLMEGPSGSYTGSYGILSPANLKRVIDRKEIPSDVNPYLYSLTGIRTSRYDGSSVYSQNINKYTSGDQNTFGKTPSIEVRKAYFAYYNSINDLYPLVNNKISMDIKYSIGLNGDISSPIMDESSNINLINSLTDKKAENNLKIYADSSIDKEFKEINGFFKADKIGYKPYPIFYSQTSSKGYSNEINLKGLTELLGPQTYHDYSFKATGHNNPTNSITDITHSEQLSPDNVESISINPSSNQTSSYDPLTGETLLPVNDTWGLEGQGLGRPLSDKYSFKFEHTVPTTFINDTRWKWKYDWFRKFALGPKSMDLTNSFTNTSVGFYELWIEGKGLKQNWYYSWFSNILGGSNIGMVDKVYKIKNPKLFMNVYFSNTSSPVGYDIRSFDVSEDLMKIANKDVPSLMRGDSIIINFDHEIISKIIRDNGLPTKELLLGGPLRIITWTIKGEVDNNIVQGSSFRIKVRGHLQPKESPAVHVPPNYFYPRDEILEPGGGYVKAYDSITLVGTKTEESRLIEIDSENPKYWDFAESGSNKIYNSIHFKIPNGNKAWGKGFKQEDLTYNPSSSKYFQNGEEPPFTTFPKIVDAWEAEPLDQIRFGNDEDQVYNIMSVEGPKTLSNPTPELKLTLDRDIDPGTDLNNFLIRRWKKENGNIIINTPFPYGAEPKQINTKGFLFPENMSEEIEKDPNKILKDLSDKGIIE